jgi:hypothetical protein
LRFLVVLATVVCTVAAVAAELPTRNAKVRPPEAKPPTCEIGGGPGFVTPGGVCVRISGYVSVGATSGNVRH